jgi:hypothetical protein
VREWYGVQVPEAAKTGAKVAFKQIAKQLEATLLPPTIPTAEGTIMLLPDQSTRIIPVGDVREALYLTGLLNSSPLRCLAYLSVPPKGGVPWRQFQSWNVAFLPIRKYNPANELCQAIRQVSDDITKSPRLASEHQDDLDTLVARLYGIAEVEISAMTEHLRLVQGHAESVANRTSDAASSQGTPTA